MSKLVVIPLFFIWMGLCNMIAMIVLGIPFLMKVAMVFWLLGALTSPLVFVHLKEKR
jgi:hypothetical protein